MRLQSAQTPPRIDLGTPCESQDLRVSRGAFYPIERNLGRRFCAPTLRQFGDLRAAYRVCVAIQVMYVSCSM
jgi:hypothetical protein